MSHSIHIFRRDLRLDDNTALLSQIQQNHTIIPVFIFDTRQIENNAYRSDNLVQFMIESLKDLQTQVDKHNGELYFFLGKSDEIIEKLLKSHDVESVFVNRDYTPFAQKKDEEIETVCEKHNVRFEQYDDLLLSPIDGVKKQDGGWYTVFTPFYRTAREIDVPHPQKAENISFFTGDITSEKAEDIFSKVLETQNDNLSTTGGRKVALELLDSLDSLDNYLQERNFPSIKGTSYLSAHNKFGTVSIREVFYRAQELFGRNSTFSSELYWRDFYTYISYHFPTVYGNDFKSKYKDLDWPNNAEWFDAWCQGKTGFPIVDAGMRQLNETGYMHNRVRMIVASFLTKDLHIDWRKGERYFAQKLIDYDPAVNNGSWQWAASTGCDAQPYFRIFNPWLQQKRFDTECEYIKKWIPELAQLSSNEIHNLSEQRPLGELTYPQPIVDHKKEKDVTLAMFKSI